jgi:hypothetical protein
MAKTLTDMRPSFAADYDLDDQLVTLAIAKAAVGIAADAASQATGMGAQGRSVFLNRTGAEAWAY